MFYTKLFRFHHYLLIVKLGKDNVHAFTNIENGVFGAKIRKIFPSNPDGLKVKVHNPLFQKFLDPPVHK